eukprot:TRINITY_DN2290_c0_g1_i1.p1 TRINITY_DN2290_c0_g1~~TRINITY_DN2290_c0_g1_i1.p1  ORF type:complete len:184 (-),score=60.50 TRINITY_DN2290_c0_g1_i1:49-600(-)
MPKNKGKGGKNRRRGKNQGEIKRELQTKGEGQEYGQVLRMLGNGRLEAYCFDGKKRLCHIRGKMRKRMWVNQGDIILIGLRDFQDGKADVVLKYNGDEALLLKKKGQLPKTAHIDEDEHSDAEDIGFDFTGDQEGDEEEELPPAQPDRDFDMEIFSDDEDEDDYEDSDDEIDADKVVVDLNKL